MAPYSNEYILQYIAKLETGDYTKGLDKIQGKYRSIKQIFFRFKQYN